VPPAVGAISASLPTQTIGASTVSVRLSWTAADDVAGVAATELQMRRSGGAYTRVALAGPASTTALVTLVPGASYTFRVRAADARGNVSAWRTLGPFTAKLAQESTSGLARHGTWSRVTGSHLSGGASRRATSRGASVTFTFYGRSIAWVAIRGTRGGRAQVRIDGVLVATVDTRTGSTTYRRTVFSRVLERRATHRIQITALGTGFVDVDAFLVLP
jgi:chitodextrinase